MSWLETIHERHVIGRRAQVLAQHLQDLVPRAASVLDVGCGDGQIAALLAANRPDVDVRGVDVLVRPTTQIPVEAFDGRHLPFPDQAFDVVTFVDVLHHCDWAVDLLREASRVARQAIVIKDHSLQGFAAGRTLRLMDWVGNHRHGVALPYNYWRPEEWKSTFASLALNVETLRTRLNLYQWPANWVFERSLHFVARLAVSHA